ncbi:hypothetical protein ACFQ7N_39755 [Streptomyces niveus]|uniref:hypothetical protein n=1 Tax=Streptomyces niveus TaxID=193462 RepID=UPI00367862E0
MSQRNVLGTVYDGIPAPVTAIPTGFPTTEGSLLMALVLAVDEAADRADVDAFVERHRFVPRDQTSRAVDSQARWTRERDGRVSVTFLADDGVSSMLIPVGPEMDRWAALARTSGGTVAVMMTYGVPADLDVMRRHLGPQGGPYWHLSVGCVPV